MKILVLGGGISSEREISFRSAYAVRDALTDLGHAVGFYDPKKGFDEITNEAKDYDLVMPILHGEGGEDGFIQKLLEDAGISFFGSDSSASKICFDKFEYKKLMHQHDVLTPNGAIVSKRELPSHPLATQPFVLKPITGGSSIHTYIERRLPADFSTFEEAFDANDDSMLIEQLIVGVEITVPVLGDEALPVIEIVPPEGKEFDFENKYNGSTAEICPPNSINESMQRSAKEIATKIHKLAGCRHISRTDMLVTAKGDFYVLETNTMPGLTAQSLFPKSAEVAGLPWHKLVERFVKLSA